MTRRISRETLAPRHMDEIFFRKVLGGNSMMLLSLRIILFTHPFRTPFLKLLLRSFISKERDYDSSSLLPALRGVVQQFFAHRVSPPFVGKRGIFLPCFCVNNVFNGCTIRFEEAIVKQGSTSATRLYDNPFHAAGLENYHSAHANANNL